MDTKICILFYVKRTKVTRSNRLPGYIRITINGKRFETSTQRYIERSKWSVQAGRMKGNHLDARNINTYLDSLKNKVYKIQTSLIQEYQPVTMENVKAKWI